MLISPLDPYQAQIQIPWPVEYLVNTSVCWSRLSIKSRSLSERTGLWPVGNPYNITRMQCFGYMHTGILWVFCMFLDHRVARNRMRTVTGSARFMCRHRMGSCWFHTGLGMRLCMRAPCGCHKRAWEYPYVQSCRAGQGPMRPVSAPSCYIYKVK